jgi:hypothetical protein
MRKLQSRTAPPAKKQNAATKLVGAPKTAGYQSDLYSQSFYTPRDLPPFTFLTIQAMLMEPTIRLGLSIRSAVLQGAEFAFKKPGSDEWQSGVQAQNPVVAAFVLRQLNKIWQHHLDALLTAQIWGWAAAEVTYKLTPYGLVEIDRLMPSHARDVLALTSQGNDIAGVRFLRIKDSGNVNGSVDLAKPRCIWHAFNPESRRPYGDSILRGPYSPWADKWLNGGALDVRRLFMKKNAYGGDDITYPMESYTMPNGSVVEGRDLARQIVEQLQAGGVTTRPASYDDKGNELWKLTRATVPANPQHILQYPKDLDVEMLRGMEIPDDILTAEASGAWAGKQVPMMAFYQGLERWLRALLGDCVEIIQELVDLNFGKNTWFEVTTKPLVKQAQEQNKESEQQPGGDQQPLGGGNQPGGPSPQQGQQPQPQQQQRMSLDVTEAIGRGVLDAAELVKAAREVMAIRLSTDASGHEHKGKGEGGGQFVAQGKGGNGSQPAKKNAQPMAKPTAPKGYRKPPPSKKLSEKAQRAKDNHKLVDKAIQRYAEEHNEPRFATAIGGVSFPNSEPVDVAIPSTDAMRKSWFAEAGRYRQEKLAGGKPTPMKVAGPARHGVELKTMVDNSNQKLTMDAYAQVRKIEWEREHKGSTYHTVVSDDSAVFDTSGAGKHDHSKRVYYYRRGVAGSARVDGMHRCTEAELKKLMAMPNEKLPPNAQRKEQPWLTVGRWKPFTDDHGKGYRNSKSGQIVRPKK